jgi:hypothetical protein
MASLKPWLQHPPVRGFGVLAAAFSTAAGRGHPFSFAPARDAGDGTALALTARFLAGRAVIDWRARRETSEIPRDFLAPAPDEVSRVNRAGAVGLIAVAAACLAPAAVEARLKAQSVEGIWRLCVYEGRRVAGSAAPRQPLGTRVDRAHRVARGEPCPRTLPSRPRASTSPVNDPPDRTATDGNRSSTGTTNAVQEPRR